MDLPDLILLDIMMPEMDGYEVCRRFKTADRTKDIPVIFISAMNETFDKVKAFSAGAVDYVTKPFNAEELIARVNTQLELQRQKQQTERLLENVLPQKIIIDLKETGHSPPERYENVSILFADMVNFTAMSGKLSPEELIKELSDIFTAFDDIIDQNGCERIKTMGDAYLAVCGLPEQTSDHGGKIIRAALEFISYLEERNRASSHRWQVRIGVHSGEVIAGIVGTRKYLYDIFGAAVNIASRVETSSESMRVSVTENTRLLTAESFRFIDRRMVDLKGIGATQLYFVENL